jgi:hypothetical protein
MTDISQLGKGAIPDIPSDRDFVIQAPLIIDWFVPFTLPEPPNEDQNGSSSCVGQGWSYYHWQIRPKDYCRRDIYAWIFYPGGGAQIRDGGIRITKFGQDTRDNVQDPKPETELAMEDKTGLDPNRERIYQEVNSFVLLKDIDTIANAIVQYKGVVFGLIGSNEGWQNMVQPRPPLPGEVQWGHCLYLFGYHLHDGKKCVIAKSSWGTVGNTTVHHITEDYFINNGTFIFNPWTLIPKGDFRMLVFFQVKGNQTIWSLLDGEWVGFADPTIFANYINGRPNVIIQIDESEFNKLKTNPDLFKS